MVDGRTSLKALSNENFQLANLDSLTGLPNRRQFFARLDEEFLAAQTQGYRLAVGVIDLDGFKPVNDIYGHAVGDKLLIAVGERLLAACGEAHVARLGGDEFALIVKEVSDAELLKRGEKICAALRKTFELDGSERADIGIGRLHRIPRTGFQRDRSIRTGRLRALPQQADQPRQRHPVLDRT